MSAVRRILTMAGLAVLRTYRSPADLMWIVVLPVVLSFVMSIWFGGGGEQAAQGPVVLLTPRGESAGEEYPALRAAFAVMLVFALAALITRAGSIHDERRKGTLARALACGIPYREVVAAHVVAIGVTGLVQATLLVVITGFLGFSWFASGWSAALLPVAAAVFVCAGIAVGVAGFVTNESRLQFIAGGGPNLLAMLAGAFFPLDGAPAAVQRLTAVNPVYWAMKALDGGFLYEGFASQAGPLAVVLLVGVLGIVLGVQGLRRLDP